MKINVTEEISKRSLLSHFILNLPRKAIEDMSKSLKIGDLFADVKLIINGHECPVKKVIEGFDNQLDRIYKDGAKKLFDEKFESIITDKLYEVSEVINDLKSRLDEEVTKRLEDWEKDPV